MSGRIARDLGRLLGCYGHVSALRRTRVGPFTEADACQVAALEEAGPDGNGRPPPSGRDRPRRGARRCRSPATWRCA